MLQYGIDIAFRFAYETLGTAQAAAESSLAMTLVIVAMNLLAQISKCCSL